MKGVSDCSGIVYDENCSICKTFTIPEARDNTNIVSEYGAFIIAINPRFSPHPYRTAIVPKSHIGKDGKYGMAGLYPDDRDTYHILRKMVTGAIINVCESKKLKLKQREELPLVDCIERPSVHPSADLFPTYEEPPVVHNISFPRYDKVFVRKDEEIYFQTDAILASFPKEASGLEMPADLRKKIADDLRIEFEKLKIV